jgi:hypothetical protein
MISAFFLSHRRTIWRAHAGLSSPLLADQLTLPQPGRQIMPTTLLPAPPDFQTFLRPCMQQKFRPLAHFLTNHKTALQSRLQCYSQNTYVDKILALLDHLPSCVDIFYGMNVDKKWKFLDYLPTSYVHTKLFQKREHYSRGTLFIDIM